MTCIYDFVTPSGTPPPSNPQGLTNLPTQVNSCLQTPMVTAGLFTRPVPLQIHLGS